MWGFHFLYLAPCLMVANCYISLSIYLYIYLIYIYIYLCSLPQCLLLYILSPLTGMFIRNSYLPFAMAE